MRNKWQARLRELETAELLAANERAAEADRKAKEAVALRIEKARAEFVDREILAARLATERALEILKTSIDRCTPDDAAKLFAVAHSIGSAALGLPGQNLNIAGIGASPVNIVTHLTYDAMSYKVDQIQKEFLLEHEHTQKERLLAEIDQRAAEWERLNGSNGE